MFTQALFFHAFRHAAAPGSYRSPDRPGTHHNGTRIHLATMCVHIMYHVKQRFSSQNPKKNVFFCFFAGLKARLSFFRTDFHGSAAQVRTLTHQLGITLKMFQPGRNKLFVPDLGFSVVLCPFQPLPFLTGVAAPQPAPPLLFRRKGKMIDRTFFDPFCHAGRQQKKKNDP